MIFHENRLPADDCLPADDFHEISYRIRYFGKEASMKLSSTLLMALYGFVYWQQYSFIIVIRSLHVKVQCYPEI